MDSGQTGLRSVHDSTPRFSGARTISALILREMSSTYGRSPGGYLWAVLEPALGLGLLVAIFSIGFRSPPLGDNFAVFYASGLLPFMMFTSVSSKVQQSINYSRQLLGYPRVTFMDALLARFILAVLTHAVVSALILGFLLTFTESRTHLELGRMINAFAMAAAVGFGVGVLNCLLVSRHAIYATIWSVISRPLLLVSGVIFMHEAVPQPYAYWLEWNPVLHAVSEGRRALYYSYVGEYVSPLYAYGFALVTATLGLFFLHSYYRDLLER